MLSRVEIFLNGDVSYLFNSYETKYIECLHFTFLHRVVDVGTEWRTFSNEKSTSDPSRVGAVQVDMIVIIININTVLISINNKAMPNV